ncbi:MAG: DUF4468 domain-containing protein [Bacteroidia bacterium]|nr:DUF4468 domain-containing protein [Bacteroidia bacterium]
MKKVMALCIVIMSSIMAYSQTEINIPYDSITGESYYTEVKETPLSKDKLFSNAKVWLATNLNSYKRSVDLEDPASGKIIAKIVNVEPGKLLTTTEKFTITIDCKDKKFRYKISDIVFETVITVGGKTTNHNVTMSGYKKFYDDKFSDATVKRAIELDQKYREIGASIVKTMSVNDDF